MKKTHFVGLAVVLMVGLVFGSMQLKASMAEKNIVETAVEAGAFNTLVTAVKTAGLVETLSGPGPFTVFAPTDDAFNKLPEGTITALLKDKEKLIPSLPIMWLQAKLWLPMW